LSRLAWFAQRPPVFPGGRFFQLSDIAVALTARGIKTSRGNDNWTATQVSRVRQLAAA